MRSLAMAPWIYTKHFSRVYVSEWNFRVIGHAPVISLDSTKLPPRIIVPVMLSPAVHESSHSPTSVPTWVLATFLNFVILLGIKKFLIITYICLSLGISKFLAYNSIWLTVFDLDFPTLHQNTHNDKGGNVQKQITLKKKKNWEWNWNGKNLLAWKNFHKCTIPHR